MKTKFFIFAVLISFLWIISAHSAKNVIHESTVGIDKYCVATAEYGGQVFSSGAQVDCNTALYVLYGKLCKAGWDHDNCDLYD